MGRRGNSVNAIYHSVPPRPFSYTFSDILQASLQTRTPGLKKGSRSKTAPASSITPEEFAERFKYRPTTRPAVIDLGCAGVKMYAGSGAVCRFNKPGFPAVRTRNGPSGSNKYRMMAFEALPPQPLTERGTSSTTGLHLAPLSRSTAADPDPDTLCPIHPRKVNTLTRSQSPDLPPARHPGLRSSASSLRSRGKSPSGSQYRGNGVDPPGRSTTSSKPVTTSDASDSQWQELSSSKLSTLDALTFSANAHALGEHAGFAQALSHSEDYGDLSELPKPKRILPRRDLPWVFRFKVKKELNALSKIMASKPAGASAMAAVGPTG